MNLLLFIIILIVSFIAVRIGAVAFELTGLERSLARFQALSCFTGTGFTTREAELITGNAQRRRIASILIVIGHAGLVTLIATFANTLRPNVVSWVNWLILVIGIWFAYTIFTKTRFASKLNDFIRANIEKKQLVKKVSFEELTIATGGYGISQIEICENSPVLNKTLLDSDLRAQDILVLAIERNEETIPNPSAETKFLLGDKVICFGKLGTIRKKVCVVPA